MRFLDITYILYILAPVSHKCISIHGVFIEIKLFSYCFIKWTAG